MVYIIADDLTGATDAGVQLSKQGYDTVVSISDYNNGFSVIDDSINNKNTILVIDSESRELEENEAKVNLRKIINKLPISNDDIIYKKVDSTLRGNIAIELNEIMQQLDYNICFFAPSFPQNNRVVVGGYLIVENKPLGMSEYYEGKLNFGEASYIPSLLKKCSDLEVKRVDLKDVMQGPDVIINQVTDFTKKGKKIFVFDALTKEQLEDILKSSLRIDEPILLSGSAGLSFHLYNLISNPPVKSTYKFKETESPFLIVAGTRRKIIRDQIEFLQNKINLEEIKINISELTKNKNKYLNIYKNKATKALINNKNLVIRPSSVPEFKNLPKREIEILIRNLLGELTSLFIEKTSLKNLILTGGDTALGVCKALGIQKLKIMEEVLPGIPLTKPLKNELRYLNVITKAGGFGKEKTLYEIIERHQTLGVKG